MWQHVEQFARAGARSAGMRSRSTVTTQTHLDALAEARQTSGRPTTIVARTLKGRASRSSKARTLARGVQER
jgi:pyruvate dehydrogenase complex dehydrogenase (E1) component